MSDLLHFTINDPKYTQFEVLDPNAINSLIADLWFHFSKWSELNKHIQIIITSLRTKSEFTNNNFGKILSINLSSLIDEDSYKILVLILCLGIWID